MKSLDTQLEEKKVDVLQSAEAVSHGMRLLIVTQVVDRNDPVLGFFHAWIEKLAGRFERVGVVCLKEGEHGLPPNVRVYSLGKEQQKGMIYHTFLFRGLVKLRYGLRFYGQLWRLRGTYDAVFVHMNPEYVVLAGWLWRLTGKRVVLWYVHKNVDLKLRLAALFASAIATTSPESLRLSTPKKIIIGHGVDVALYPSPHQLERAAPRFLSVGRISPTKNQRLILEAFRFLQARVPGASLAIAGAPATKADTSYETALRADAENAAGVTFLGAVTPERMPALYAVHDVLLHASDTGSLDKVVLEALASGLRVVSSSEAFADTELPVTHVGKEAEAIAAAGLTALQAPWDGAAARAAISSTHDLTRLIDRLVALLSS